MIPRVRAPAPSRLRALLPPLVAAVLAACPSEPPCARGSFGAAECRVVAEQEGARLALADVVLSLHPPP